MIFEFIKGVINKMLPNNAVKNIFGAEPLVDKEIMQYIEAWSDIYSGNAPWLLNDIKSINLSKTISEELARLATMEIDISVTGSQRANYLQEQVNILKDKLRTNLEYGCALGGIMFKPNGHSIDFVKPQNFMPTSTDSQGNINGCIFADYVQQDGRKYVRLEYHRFNSEGQYIITNKAFIYNNDSIGREIDISDIDVWSNIKEEVVVNNLKKPLFSYFKMPVGNNLNINPTLGISCFANSIQQLEDLDIAYSRFADENEDSYKVIFLSQPAVHSFTHRQRKKLPRHIIGLDLGIDADNTISEHNPVLQTTVRKEGINFLLSIIGYQCGFSPGYFNFNEKTGLVTATQVEADQQRTVQTVSDIRKALQTALDDLIYAISCYADLYNTAPSGKYEISYYFKDITVSFEEDRARVYQLVLSGIFPKWKYLMEYEGYTEEEARQLVFDAQSELTNDYVPFSEE